MYRPRSGLYAGRPHHASPFDRSRCPHRHEPTRLAVGPWFCAAVAARRTGATLRLAGSRTAWPATGAQGRSSGLAGQGTRYLAGRSAARTDARAATPARRCSAYLTLRSQQLTQLLRLFGEPLTVLADGAIADLLSFGIAMQRLQRLDLITGHAQFAFAIGRVIRLREIRQRLGRLAL